MVDPTVQVLVTSYLESDLLLSFNPNSCTRVNSVSYPGREISVGDLDSYFVVVVQFNS